MDNARCFCIALFLLSLDFTELGRAVSTRGFQSGIGRGSALRKDAPERWRRGVTETHQERCAELAAPWQENAKAAPEDRGTLLQLGVRPYSPGTSRAPVFPGKNLFSFVRRVYRCCQEGQNCRSVKGIQGRQRGETDVEFLLTREILTLTLTRAELHLQLSNPNHLDVLPVLSALAKRDIPTRYSLWSRGNTVELRVDLLFLLQSLQEAAGGVGRGPSVTDIQQVVFPSTLQDSDGDLWGPVLELGLVLGCSQSGSGVSCGRGGVHLTHTPFMALYYR